MGGILAGVSIPLFVAGGAVVSAHHSESNRAPGYAAVAGGVVFLLSGATLIILGVAIGGGGVKVKDPEQDSDSAKLSPKPSLGLTEQGFGLTF